MEGDLDNIGEEDPINPLSGPRLTREERKVARFYGLVSFLAALVFAIVLDQAMQNWGFDPSARMVASGLAFVLSWGFFQFKYFEG